MDPREGVTRIGLNAVIKCLRMDGKSPSFNIAFNLDILGGLVFTNPTLYLRSCMIRAACKTFAGHEAQHKLLLETAITVLPLGVHRFSISEHPGWDSPAFCSNLYLQSSMMENLFPPARFEGGLPESKKSCQAAAYCHLRTLQPDPSAAWLRLLGDRAKMICVDTSP